MALQHPSPDPLEVLVVDDDEDTRVTVALAVRALGHACRTAEDGLRASKILSEHHADVVIADWDMPGMDGPELCRQTRVVDDEAPYTYFILMTGFQDKEHMVDGMAAGADDYQTKPVDLDELEARLVSAARVIALHRRLAERAATLRSDSERFYVAAHTDALTGVGNRLALNEELETLRARGERYGHRYSIAIADVDHFKLFNDAFGHLAGDEALRSVAGAIRVQIRTSDRLFRYGGEEFVVVLPEQSLDEAARVMERVRREIEQLGIPAPEGVLTVSFGVAELGPGDRNAREWLARADSALYASKAGGRNRVELSIAPGGLEASRHGP